MRSLFDVAFDHVFACEACTLKPGALCPVGMALMQAAHDKCLTLTEPPKENPNKA
jgi:hypothetical protein